MLFKTVISFLRYFIFWLLFFFLERAVFLVYNFKKISGDPPAEILKAFLYGLWMDASTAGYFSAIPLLVAVVLWFMPGINISRTYLKIYTYTLVALCSLLTVINFNIYREWGS